MELHYIKNKSGVFVKLGENSGGYPYLSRKTIPSFWFDKKEADETLVRYNKMRLLGSDFAVFTTTL